MDGQPCLSDASTDDEVDVPFAVAVSKPVFADTFLARVEIITGRSSHVWCPNTHESWWYEKLRDGVLFSQADGEPHITTTTLNHGWPTHVAHKKLYADYTRYHEDHEPWNAASQAPPYSWRMLQNLFPPKKRLTKAALKMAQVGGNKKKGLCRLAGLEEYRQHFASVIACASYSTMFLCPDSETVSTEISDLPAHDAMMENNSKDKPLGLPQ